MPVPASARASHSAPFIIPWSLIPFPPLYFWLENSLA
jgi:hypothetical protein